MRFLIILVFFFPAMIGKAQNFDSLRWESRVLLLRTTPKTEQLMSQQARHLLQDSVGLKERKLRVFIDNERYLQQIFPDTLTHKKANGNENKLKPTIFSVTLRGLDGALKKTWLAYFEREALYRVIDAMPMRLQELKKH